MAAKAKKRARKSTLAKARKSILAKARKALRAKGGRWTASRHGVRVLKKLDFERPVIYRGIKIEPPMAVGRRSSLAQAIRDDLRASRGRSG